MVLKLQVWVFIKAIAAFLPELRDRFYSVLGLDKGDRLFLGGIGRSPLS
ncbi:hypothetical protein [Nostoc piscinale]|nr:hypothetical protein [Nostoc piscinale]